MSLSSFTKLTTMVADVVSGLDKKSQKAVMESWNGKREEVMSLFSQKERSPKKTKDPNAPKKPRTGYIFFCQEKRESLKKKSPELSTTQLTSRLGEMWKALSEKEKNKYNEMGKKDKERYDTEMESYTPPEGTETKSRSRKEKAERTGPKRPTSSYLYFCEDMRAILKSEKPDLTGKEVTTELGRRWKELSQEQKAPYDAKASKDKERYLAEKGGESTTKGAPSKKEKAEPVQDKTPKKAEPKKAGKSTESPGYAKFCDEKREEFESDHPEWGTRKMNSELSKAWASLPDDEKAQYEHDSSSSEEDSDDE